MSSTSAYLLRLERSQRRSHEHRLSPLAVNVVGKECAVIELVGYLAAAGAASMWLPQAARAVRRRHQPEELGSLSLVTYGVAVLFNVLLLAYGVLEHAAPVVVAGATNLVCASVIVVVVAGARRRVVA